MPTYVAYNESMKPKRRNLFDHSRRAALFVIGSTVIAVGILLLFLPGPGTPVIIGGLALLALEFEWAQVALKKARHHANRINLRRKSKTEVADDDND